MNFDIDPQKCEAKQEKQIFLDILVQSISKHNTVLMLHSPVGFSELLSKRH